MRHRLVHAYFDVDTEILWNTAIDAIPPLPASLTAIVGDVSPPA